MSSASPTAERREQIAGELAEWLHAAAREAQRRLMEAESTEEFVSLSGSLSTLARGVRQSLLVQERMESQRLAAEKKAEEEATPSEFVPRHVKRVRIRAAVGRYVAREMDEEEDIDLLWADMNARLDEWQAADDFLDIPIDVLVARLCRDLGFEPPEPGPAAPDAAASAGGGPPADPGGTPGEERVVEGASPPHGDSALHAPNTS
ncbi:MAG: hypothetical protein ACJ798_18095 [Phenylobacterium sp.]